MWNFPSFFLHIWLILFEVFSLSSSPITDNFRGFFFFFWLDQFIVKSATWLAHGIISLNSKWKFYWIRKLDVPPKIIKIFIWLMLHYSLHSRANLAHHQLDICTIYPLCILTMKLNNNYLLNCSFSSSLRKSTLKVN